MKNVAKLRLWLSVPLPGTQAICVEEVGATVRGKNKATKRVACSLPGWGVCTWWGLRKVLSDGTDVEA